MTRCATRSIWPIMVRIRSSILSVATLKSWLKAPSHSRMKLKYCQWLRLLFWRDVVVEDANDGGVVVMDEFKIGELAANGIIVDDKGPAPKNTVP